MPAQEIARGLYRWTAAHPDWKPADDWGELVGSVLYLIDGDAALIDPLIPREGREEFLSWLDATIGERSVSVLTTIRWHRRDRSELAERYRSKRNGAWNRVPAGVKPHWLRGAGEVTFWLAAVETLVVGDSLIGEAGESLRLCPESWLQEHGHVSRLGLAALLEPLLALPIERVLVSHGEPVLHGGQAALASAISEAADAGGTRRGHA